MQQLNKIAVSFVQDKPTLSEYWYLSSRKHNCSRCRGSYSRSLSVSNIDEFLHCVVALLDLICLVCSTVNNTIFTRNNTASHLFSLVQTLITTYNYQLRTFTSCLDIKCTHPIDQNLAKYCLLIMKGYLSGTVALQLSQFLRCRFQLYMYGCTWGPQIM